MPQNLNSFQTDTEKAIERINLQREKEIVDLKKKIEMEKARKEEADRQIEEAKRTKLEAEVEAKKWEEKYKKKSICSIF